MINKLLACQSVLTCTRGQTCGHLPEVILFQGMATFTVCKSFCVQAQHALSVSLNKLGDLQYRQGDVESARACYHEALKVGLHY